MFHRQPPFEAVFLLCIKKGTTIRLHSAEVVPFLGLFDYFRMVRHQGSS